MEVWRVMLIVVLGWLLCGVLSIIIPQCSRRLREKLIRLSRQNVKRACDRYERRWGHSLLRAHQVIDGYGMSDNQHLNLTYAMLIISGPWAFAILRSVHRKHRPESSGHP